MIERLIFSFTTVVLHQRDEGWNDHNYTATSNTHPQYAITNKQKSMVSYLHPPGRYPHLSFTDGFNCKSPIWSM